MPSIRWGLGTGADLCVPFLGNVSLSGCRLIGAGGADDNVALAWDEHTVDANTVACWRMNGDWTDASAGGYDLAATGTTFLNPGWMGQSGVWDASTDTAKYPSFLDWWYGPATCEFWVYWRGGATQYQRLFELSNSRNRQGFECERVIATSNWEFRAVPTTARRRYARFASFPLDTWTHVAVTFDGTDTNGSIRVWYNGVEQITYAQGSQNIDSSQPTWSFYVGNGYEGTRAFYGSMDDLRLSNVQRYSADFTPVRYKSASQNAGIQPYVQCSQAGLTGMVPAQVSWSATVGASYGQVKRVLVNDVSAGWTAVGGDYPTSPVAISGLVLASEDAVRVELEPKADALQSETPVLDWVQLEYTAASTGRPWLPVLMQSGRYA
jgi:hypothetical protein